MPSVFPNVNVDILPLTDCLTKSSVPSSETKVAPVTSSLALGELVPIPTLPSFLILTFSELFAPSWELKTMSLP